jgi:hypothetical protein
MGGSPGLIDPLSECQRKLSGFGCSDIELERDNHIG